MPLTFRRSWWLLKKQNLAVLWGKLCHKQYICLVNVKKFCLQLTGMKSALECWFLTESEVFCFQLPSGLYSFVINILENVRVICSRCSHRVRMHLAICDRGEIRSSPWNRMDAEKIPRVYFARDEWRIPYWRMFQRPKPMTVYKKNRKPFFTRCFPVKKLQ